MYFRCKSKASLGRFAPGSLAWSGKHPVRVSGTSKSDKDGKLYCHIVAVDGMFKGRTWSVPEGSLRPRDYYEA